MACQRCGACCVSCTMLGPELTKENQESEMDKLRWMVYHRVDAQILTNADGKKTSLLIIPLLCQQLVQGDDFKYSCKVYENRPLVCRKYLCNKAKALDKGVPAIN